MAPTTLLYGVQPSCSKWHFIPWNGQQRRYFVCKMWNRKQQHQPVCIITVVFFSIRFHGTKFKLFFLIHQALKFSNYYELHTNIKPIVFRMFFFSILLIEKIIYQYLLIRCSFAIKNTSGKFYSTFNEEKLIRSNFRRHNFLYTVKCWLYGFQSLVSFSYLSIHCHISLSLISFAIVVFVVVVVTFELTPLQCDMKKYASLNQSHTSAFYRNERSKHWMYDCHFSCNLNHMMLLGSFDLSAFVIIEDRFSVTGVFRLITNYWKSRHTINTTDALSLSVTRTHSLTQWCFKNSKSAQFKTESHQSDFMRLFRASAYTWSHTANQKGTMMTNQRNMCVALFFFCLFFYQSLVFFWYNPYHMKHYYVCENFIVICAHDVRMPNSSNSVAGVKLTKCWLWKCVSSKSSCFFSFYSRVKFDQSHGSIHHMLLVRFDFNVQFSLHVRNSLEKIYGIFSSLSLNDHLTCTSTPAHFHSKAQPGSRSLVDPLISMPCLCFTIDLPIVHVNYLKEEKNAPTIKIGSQQMDEIQRKIRKKFNTISAKKHIQNGLKTNNSNRTNWTKRNGTEKLNGMEYV